MAKNVKIQNGGALGIELFKYVNDRFKYVNIGQGNRNFQKKKSDSNRIWTVICGEKGKGTHFGGGYFVYKVIHCWEICVYTIKNEA